MPQGILMCHQVENPLARWMVLGNLNEILINCYNISTSILTTIRLSTETSSQVQTKQWRSNDNRNQDTRRQFGDLVPLSLGTTKVMVSCLPWENPDVSMYTAPSLQAHWHFTFELWGHFNSCKWLLLTCIYSTTAQICIESPQCTKHHREIGK